MPAIGQKADAARIAEGMPLRELSMKMRVVSVWLVCGISTCCPWSAHAGNAPTQLYNKSIMISWTESRDMTTVEGEKRNRIVSTDYGLYVSSAGRVFSQFGRTRGGKRGGRRVRHSAGSSEAPDGSSIKTGNGRSHRVLSFNGHSIHATDQFKSGARRISVTFDDGFGSCTASVIYGKEAGVPGVISHGMSGKLHLVESVGISAPTCSIRDGNIFSD